MSLDQTLRQGEYHRNILLPMPWHVWCHHLPRPAHEEALKIVIFSGTITEMTLLGNKVDEAKERGLASLERRARHSPSIDGRQAAEDDLRLTVAGTISVLHLHREKKQCMREATGSTT